MGPVASTVHVPWEVFVAVLTLGTFIVVRVEFRNESHNMDLADAGLLPAFVFTPPGGLLAAVLIAGLIRAVWLRQTLTKSVFNVALPTVTSMLGWLTYKSILGTHSPLSGVGWVAGIAALAVVYAFTDTAIQLAIGLSGGRKALAGFRAFGSSLVANWGIQGALGLVAIHMLSAGPTISVMFVVVALAVALGYHFNGQLRARYAALSQLHRFDRALAGLAEQSDVIAAVLGETVALLNAGTAQLIFGSGDDAEIHTLIVGGLVQSSTGRHPLAPYANSVAATVISSGADSDPNLKGALSAAGFEDAIIVPVNSDDELLAILLVADRLGGDNITFNDGDASLLESLAAHTGMALRSSYLLDQLRQEMAVKEHQAFHDGLTGLPNRALFSVTLDEAIAERPPGTIVGVMLMDLDGFKAINDTMGHDMGDALLQELGIRLNRVVGTEGLIARLGGDEFAVMVPNATGLDDLRAFAERLMLAVQEPVEASGTTVKTRASIGVAAAPQHGDDRSILLRRADVAMYQAKRRRDGIAMHGDRHSDPHVGSPSLTSALREAIDLSALEMHYQPKVDMATGAVTGVEALLRWTHPTYGPIRPDQSIPAAERSGLIRPLTRWALDTGLAQLATWRQAGLALDLAINLSPTLLSDAGVADEVEELLRKHGVPAGALTLELTESVLGGKAIDGYEVAEFIARMGVRLSIDDFGIGSSSLARLKVLPVSELKIDQSFVKDIATNDTAATIVASTIELAGNLGLAAVAEGVETLDVWRGLKALHCDAAQGFLLSPPLPAVELVDWLRRRTARGTSPRTRWIVNMDHDLPGAS